MATATRTRTRRTTDPAKREAAAAKRDELTAAADAFRGERTDAELFAAFADLPIVGKYSLRNCLLILAQRPDATDCAGFVAWKTLGRQVRKGETGIAILTPAGTAKDDDDAKPATDGDKPAPRQFFKIGYVFDISQTDPIDAP